ncbi:MAG: tRNA (cytidine/uridine-2'-O-)-methyltransferase TrmJ [Candidatus Heimdallarchaeota archaeon LC_3]|nr:MAG: tRNA (cytidine/uridine-2'-O-)-methyltransferase TrmJ [Candidatus Heimdallarchaeota archaeon LC_3]
MMWTIILVRPEKASNLGAICRLIANFQATGLILVDSKIDATDLELIMTARRAMEVFYEAHHVETIQKALKLVSYSIATTARVSTQKSPKRYAMTVENIPWNQLGVKPGLVFGPESAGLLNDELKLFNMLITIPTSKNYPALNISHATAILLHEMYKINFTEKVKIKTKQELIETENWHPQKDATNDLLERLLINFDTYTETFVEPFKQESTKKIFRNIIYRAKLSDVEAGRMIGAIEAWEFHWKQKQKKS